MVLLEALRKRQFLPLHKEYLRDTLRQRSRLVSQEIKALRTAVLRYPYQAVASVSVPNRACQAFV